MTIRPLGDQVLIKPAKEREVTASGILLPDTADKEKKAEGEVIAVGPGKLMKHGERQVMDVRVGDMVLFKKWGGNEVDIEGEEHKIVSQEDILAVIE